MQSHTSVLYICDGGVQATNLVISQLMEGKAMAMMMLQKVQAGVALAALTMDKMFEYLLMLVQVRADAVNAPHSKHFTASLSS